MSDPIHTAFFGGKSLHFFATPLTDGRPDGPWVDLAALVAVLPVPAGFAAYYADLFARDWFHVVHRQPNPTGGESLLAPWFVAKFPLMTLLHQLEEQGDIEHPAADKLWALLCEASGRAEDALERAAPEAYPQGANDAARHNWADLMLVNLSTQGRH